MRDVLKNIKNRLLKEIHEYNNGNTLIAALDSKSIMSVSNFNALKNRIVEDNILDMLNISLLLYSSYRAGLDSDTLEKCFTDTLLIEENIMLDEYLVYSKLEGSEKKLYELVAIINYM